METSNHKPLWTYWLNLAEVELEYAICLSLDFHPSILEELEERYLPAETAHMLRTVKVHYLARRDAAVTHIRARTLNGWYNEAKHKYFVKLADFREWGESLPAPFSFPDEFPRHRPPATAPEPPKLDPSARSENANLRIIAAMLALLQDKEGGRFPSEARIIEVLVENYGQADGVSKRNLETVFASAKRTAGDDLKPKAARRK